MRDPPQLQQIQNVNFHFRYNYVSMALIISSFGKMLLILMVIWDYKQLEYSWLVSTIVLASNTEALSGTKTKQNNKTKEF